ncbi:MAG: prepilin-type N-terminal cleavage/methylation domain-containing protein [Acidobacteriota bacterium]|nr:prepilin-type N-terminal cleavage/methylation domain-containing protein [Acidobacteriota bacterium]
MRQDGFTLVEVLLAIFLMAIGLLAVAPMFIYAAQGNDLGGDYGSMGAIAVERLELLRGASYPSLAAGGSLTTNVTGYFDDSDPDYLIRWRIVDDVTRADTKLIVVRAWATGVVQTGARKQITVGMIRGRL